jgi:hypothetical protein
LCFTAKLTGANCIIGIASGVGGGNFSLNTMMKKKFDADN